jgi:uncharacterized protein (TIGR02145 family)
MRGETMKRTGLSILIIATSLTLLNSCSEPPTASTIGSARLNITLRNVGELSKSSSIDLQSLFIEMSKGTNIIHDTIPLNGNSEVLVTQNYVDMSEGDWSLNVESRDQNDEIIHTDSTEFTVIAEETVEVSLSLVSKYSMLIANFLGIAEDVYRCELVVDGNMVADSTFLPQTDAGYNITLEYDYLTTGAEHLIVMDAYGEYEGVEYLFYTGDTTITVLAGIDQSYEIDLEWVGPFGALRGDVSIEVTIGATGLVSMNGNFPIPSGVLVDIDGNRYDTILIGEQVWMADNLKVTHYRDGTEIPNVTGNVEWSALINGAYSIYNHNASNEVDDYGALYNWFAVVDSRNIAPDGWHIPTDDEWKELEMALGMSQSEADASGYRGTNEGSKLAGDASMWTNGGLENDSEFGSSGFTALPAGIRDGDGGSYSELSEKGFFWSATGIDNDYATMRYLYYVYSKVYRAEARKRHGLSVRCVQD